jgi:glycosyltransferase involved in cell wall biosynthesis
LTSGMLRILYFADIRFPLERANGIQTMETCYALGARGHEVELIVRPDTGKPARDPFEYYGLPPLKQLWIERAPSSGPAAARRLGYLAFSVGRAAGSRRADVVFTRDLGVASLLLRIPRGLRPPVVYESHGYAPDVAAALPGLIATAAAPAPGKLRRLERREARVWQRAEGYVTITAALAADLAGRYGDRQRVAVVPDGVRLGTRDSGLGTRSGFGIRDSGVGTDSGFGIRDSGFEKAGSGTREAGSGNQEAGSGFPIVAYAGHLYAWKGVDVLLEALALVPAVRGLIVGGHEAEPDLGRVKELAERLGISARMTFTGLVAPARVPDLLRSAAILALPNPASAISNRFTSPLKLFEYMAAGRAIVASDLPSVREVLHDGVDALLVPPGDAPALAEAVRRLVAEPALAEQLARRAAEAAPGYSWSRRAERLEALFAQVIATGR